MATKEVKTVYHDMHQTSAQNLKLMQTPVQHTNKIRHNRPLS